MIGIGRHVEYRGSQDEAWGRYIVAGAVTGDTGVRYHLATPGGNVVLRGVSGASITPLPDSPAHRVISPVLRANIAQAEAARQEWLPYIHEAIATLATRVMDLIDRARPCEAEAELLGAERLTGCISHSVYAQRMNALVVTASDRSWTFPRVVPGG
jgi:hypothetical protein